MSLTHHLKKIIFTTKSLIFLMSFILVFIGHAQEDLIREQGGIRNRRHITIIEGNLSREQLQNLLIQANQNRQPQHNIPIINANPNEEGSSSRVVPATAAFFGTILGLGPANPECSNFFRWGFGNDLPFRGMVRDSAIYSILLFRSPFHISRIGSAIYELKRYQEHPPLGFVLSLDAIINKAAPYTFLSVTALDGFPLFRNLLTPTLFLSNFAKGLERKESLLRRMYAGRPWFEMRDSHGHFCSPLVSTTSLVFQLPISLIKSLVVYRAFQSVIASGPPDMIPAYAYIMLGGYSAVSTILTVLLNSDDLAKLSLHPWYLASLGMGLTISSAYAGFSRTLDSPFLMGMLVAAEGLNEYRSINYQAKANIGPIAQKGTAAAKSMTLQATGYFKGMVRKGVHQIGRYLGY